MHIRHFHRYQNEVVDVSTAAPAAPAPPAAHSPAPAAPAPAPTALAATVVTAPAPPAPAPGADTPFGWIPEKFHVKLADGSLDTEASSRKVEEHRSNLERRLGSGDIRPAAATDYKVNLPPEIAEKISAEELGASAGFKEFLAKAHDAGLSQKQVDVMTAELVTRGMLMREQGAVLDQAECTAALKQVDGWKSEQEYASQMSAASRAVKAYGGANAEALIATYGNDPAICQLLAAVGAELAEDRQATPEAQAALGQTLDEMMNLPAYTNGNDPRHKEIKDKVDALQARLSGTRPVNGGKTISFKT